MKIEEVEFPEVGKVYEVPAVVWRQPSCGKIRPAWQDRIIPITGPEHEDAEHIGFVHRHWHIDWRFVSIRAWSHIEVTAKRHRMHLSRNRDSLPKLAAHVAYGRVIVSGNTTGEVIRVKRTCRRLLAPYPNKHTIPSVPWLTSLEEAYQNHSAKCGVCPHRGLSLAGSPMENGARVCPGHGLAWDKETGKLVRRDGRVSV